MNTDNPDAAELWSLAERLADAARSPILKHFRAPLQIQNKDAAGFDPVTAADQAAEAAIRDILAQTRPQDSILGEEFGHLAGTSGLTWVIDPIDGTRAFICGTPSWGVLIALCDANGPVLGLIDQPYTRERFCGGLGRAGFDGPLGAQPLTTRGTTELGKARLFTTFPEVGTADERAGFEAVAAEVELTRYGLDCYAYGLVALGQVDLVIEAGLNAYDICAPIAVIEAAGGVVSDWRGGPVHGGGQVVAAANPALHAAALARLAPFAD